MGRKQAGTRTLAATVVKTNGAWLISGCGTEAHDRTTDEITDAAASLKVAKRVAREMAVSLGFEGAPRWSLSEGGGYWELEMTEVSDEWDGQEDDE